MIVEKVENHWKISKCLKNVYDFKNIILDIHRKRIVCDMWVCMYVILFNLGAYTSSQTLRPVSETFHCVLLYPK